MYLILAVNQEIGYLIEIKDYTDPNTKILTMNELIEAIINKVISTLAAILPMKINVNVSKDKFITVCRGNPLWLPSILNGIAYTTPLQQKKMSGRTAY